MSSNDRVTITVVGCTFIEMGELLTVQGKAPCPWCRHNVSCLTEN